MTLYLKFTVPSVFALVKVWDSPVQGHRCQGEDARVHGEKNDEVDQFAQHRSEHPLIQGVDGGLEGHTEDDEAQVSDAEVEDEQVGGFGVHLSVTEQNRQNQRVPHGAEQEDEREAQRDDHRLGFPGGRVLEGEIHLGVMFINNSRGVVRVCPTLTHGSWRRAPRFQISRRSARATDPRTGSTHRTAPRRALCGHCNPKPEDLNMSKTCLITKRYSGENMKHTNNKNNEGCT